ncbi:MAG: DUF262 domain-containing protein [Enterococcus sp.]|nr:DUF262 domain-containing protein [Enterococcus sp.]
MAIQNYSMMPIKKFLTDKYMIPNYQRDYSWEESELEDFLNDLKHTKDDAESEHFFGQIVIHNENDTKSKYLIDGQQRTITSVIFLRVLQVAYEEIYNEDKTLLNADYKKSDISSIMIGRYGDLHLTLGEADKDYFETNIQLGEPDPGAKEKKKSRARMRGAFFYLQREINKELGAASSPKKKMGILDEFYNAFVERFNVLYMEATQLDEAFMIFETLNARGKDLETADLLKNYIFSKSKTDIDNAQKQWNDMINTLGTADPTKYIRHFWNSSHTLSREKELYKNISRGIVSKRESTDFLSGLVEHAKYYHAMTNPGDDTTFSDKKIKRCLAVLNMLKAKSFYPILLSMKQADTKYSDADIADVLRRIECYVFRNSTICGHVANRAEVFFAGIAKDIYDGTLDDKKSICDAINKQIVTDKEFQDSFEIYSGTRNGKETIRYILRRIHDYLENTTEVTLNNDNVHIEHIMPEDFSQWNIDKEIHETYLWRLGNLALLDGSLNISISNKPFDQKKGSYQKSKIKPNNDLYNYSEWNEKSIEDRQKTLATYAVQIWK